MTDDAIRDSLEPLRHLVDSCDDVSSSEAQISVALANQLLADMSEMKKQLDANQQRLMQSEKMAMLGQLMAGRDERCGLLADDERPPSRHHPHPSDSLC